MIRRLLAVSLSIVVLLTFTGAPAHAQAFQIRARSTPFSFSPAAPHVAVGRVVRWTAVSGTHSVTATSANWSKNTIIRPGSPTTFRFQRAGTYRYRCRFHSSMTGGQCTGMCGRVLVP